MNYTITTPLNKNIKKSWRALVFKDLYNKDYQGYLYIYQTGEARMSNVTWESINYLNLLRAVRNKYKNKPKPIQNAKWWLDVRKGWRQKGIRYDIIKEINFV